MVFSVFCVLYGDEEINARGDEMNCLFTVEEFIILLTECQTIRVEDRWLLLIEHFPSLLNTLDFYWLENIRLTSRRRKAFKDYLVDINIEETFKKYQNQSWRYVTFFDLDYPLLLKESYTPPLLLYYKGDISLATRPTLAVIGARNHSEYSVNCLEKLLPPIINEEIVIVSGLARGVDTLAHKLAVLHNGQTVAVIGCGLDVVYPKENKSLQEHLCNNHLVLSEYPPDLKPQKTHFPMRNRIIAGISQGVLITEARRRSGTLITARMALDEGRDIYVVPGPINQPLSEGTNRLIVEGATPIIDAVQIINDRHF